MVSITIEAEVKTSDGKQVWKLSKTMTFDALNTGEMMAATRVGMYRIMDVLRDNGAKDVKTVV